MLWLWYQDTSGFHIIPFEWLKVKFLIFDTNLHFSAITPPSWYEKFPVEKSHKLWTNKVLPGHSCKHGWFWTLEPWMVGHSNFVDIQSTTDDPSLKNFHAREAWVRAGVFFGCRNHEGCFFRLLCRHSKYTCMQPVSTCHEDHPPTISCNVSQRFCSIRTTLDGRLQTVSEHFCRIKLDQTHTTDVYIYTHIKATWQGIDLAKQHFCHQHVLEAAQCDALGTMSAWVFELQLLHD